MSDEIGDIDLIPKTICGEFIKMCVDCGKSFTTKEEEAIMCTECELEYIYE